MVDQGEFKVVQEIIQGTGRRFGRVMSFATLFWVGLLVSPLGEASAPPQAAMVCTGCHGPSSTVPILPAYPKLTGQFTSYLFKQLKDMQHEKERKNALMSSFVKQMSDEDMKIVSDYYAQEPLEHVSTPDKKKAQKGALIYNGGILEKGIPACASCHGPAGEGKEFAKFPILSGQNAEYVTLQLKAFREHQRSNDANEIMRDIAQGMTDTEMEAVAAYVQGIRPTGA